MDDSADERNQHTENERGAVSRVLVFNVPAHGHVNPTLPVVAELVARTAAEYDAAAAAAARGLVGA